MRPRLQRVVKPEGGLGMGLGAASTVSSSTNPQGNARVLSRRQVEFDPLSVNAPPSPPPPANPPAHPPAPPISVSPSNLNRPVPIPQEQTSQPVNTHVSASSLFARTKHPTHSQNRNITQKPTPNSLSNTSAPVSIPGVTKSTSHHSPPTQKTTISGTMQTTNSVPPRLAQQNIQQNNQNIQQSQQNNQNIQQSQLNNKPVLSTSLPVTKPQEQPAVLAREFLEHARPSPKSLGDSIEALREHAREGRSEISLNLSEKLLLDLQNKGTRGAAALQRWCELKVYQTRALARLGRPNAAEQVRFYH